VCDARGDAVVAPVIVFGDDAPRRIRDAQARIHEDVLDAKGRERRPGRTHQPAPRTIARQMQFPAERLSIYSNALSN